MNFDKIQVVLLVIIIGLFFNQMRLGKKMEKMTEVKDTSIRDTIREIYKIDVQAIKNLGDLSSKILTTEGKLILPYDVEITGAFNVKENATFDKTVTAGLAKIGTSIHTNQAEFSHIANFGHKTNYSYLSNPDGLHINAPKDKGINFKTDGGGSTRIINNNIIAGGTVTAGLAKIGTSAHANQAEFSHIANFGNKENYSYLSNQGGLHINAPKDKGINFRTNGGGSASIMNSNITAGNITAGNVNTTRPNNEAVIVEHGIWGDWKGKKMCPAGTVAKGFNARIERAQGGGDDSGMNGIQLICGKPL